MLNRNLKLILLISFLLGGLSWSAPDSAHAATIIADGTICTLADAIIAANTDTATGGCIAGSGADTIILDYDVPLWDFEGSSTNILGGPAGLPDITSVMIIQAGNGDTIERTIGDTNPYFRIFYITSTGNLTLNGITLRGGHIKPDSGEPIGGGAIYSQGTLTLNNAVITQNIVESVFDDVVFGGGIGSEGISLTINNSSITQNNVSGQGDSATFGGGIFSDNSLPLGISNSTISDNHLSGVFFVVGGGVVTVHPTHIVDSTINNNTVTGTNVGSEGGGIYVGEASLTLTRSTIAGNSVTSQGNTARGGGISSDGSFLDIRDTTIRNNTVTSPTNAEGGGIYTWGDGEVRSSLIAGNTLNGNTGRGGGVYSDGLWFLNSTISGNAISATTTQGTATYGGVIFAASTIVQNTGNGSGIQGSSYFEGALVAGNGTVDCVGTASSAGYNLVQNRGSCVFNNTGDQVGVDPMLAPLADNGGYTQTHALLLGSPAIDKGTCTEEMGGFQMQEPPIPPSALTQDQRGFIRPFDDPSIPNALDGCDIGAFEATLLSPTLTPSQTPTFTDIPSDTPTFTPTATNTATNTPSVTPSQTPTFTDIPSDTPTFTPTATNTATNTPSVTPSGTLTFTDIPSDTPTFTLTATNTATNTPSDTPTHTPSITATATCAIIATPPNLLSPEHRAHTTDRTPTFTWSAVNNAKSYRLMVYAADHSFEFKKRVFTTSYTLTPNETLSPAKYLWRVRTQDNTCDTWTGWSGRNTLFVD